MKPLNNILHALMNDPTQSSDEHKQILVRFINALTGQATLSMKIFLNQQSRGLVDEQGNPLDTSYDHPGDPQDSFGRELPPNHLEIATIANGIRHHLYGRLHSFADLRDCSDTVALLKAPNPVPLKPNYDQPFSAEEYIGFMANQVVRESDVREALKRGHPETAARAAFQADVDRNNAQWREEGRAILLELGGLDTEYSTKGDEVLDAEYDDTDFEKLPIETQLNIVRKVAGKVDARCNQLIPQDVRGVPGAVSEMAMLRGLGTKLEEWLKETDTVGNRLAA